MSSPRLLITGFYAARIALVNRSAPRTGLRVLRLPATLSCPIASFLSLAPLATWDSMFSTRTSAPPSLLTPKQPTQVARPFHVEGFVYEEKWTATGWWPTRTTEMGGSHPLGSRDRYHLGHEATHLPCVQLAHAGEGGGQANGTGSPARPGTRSGAVAPKRSRRLKAPLVIGSAALLWGRLTGLLIPGSVPPRALGPLRWVYRMLSDDT